MTDVETCNLLAERLAARHPDDLSLDERSELNVHIASCPACATKQADYDALTTSIRHLPDVTPLAKTEPEFFWRDTPSSPRPGRNTSNRQRLSMRAFPSFSGHTMRASVGVGTLIAATILIASLVLFQHPAFNGTANVTGSTPLPTAASTAMAVSKLCPMPATGQNISCTASYTGVITGIENTASSPMQLSLRQQRDLLSGSCLLSLPVPLAVPFSGTIDAQGVLRFSMHVNSPASVVVTFVGVVNQQKQTISGTYTTSNSQHGTWNVHLI